MGYELMPPTGLPDPPRLAALIRSVAGEPRPAKSLASQGEAAASKLIRFAERARVDATGLADVLHALTEQGLEDTTKLSNRAALAYELVRQKQRLEGTDVVGFKNNSPDPRPFKDYYPQARFVFVVRDPRDVVASHLAREFPKDVEQVCKAWKGYVSKFESFSDENPDRAIFLRYENLVADPQTQTKRLTDLIGVPWSEAMLRFFDSKASIHGMGHVENDRLGRPFDASSVGRWWGELTDRQVKEIEEHLKKLMARFSYAAGS